MSRLDETQVLAGGSRSKYGSEAAFAIPGAALGAPGLQDSKFGSNHGLQMMGFTAGSDGVTAGRDSFSAGCDGFSSGSDGFTAGSDSFLSCLLL